MPVGVGSGSGVGVEVAELCQTKLSSVMVTAPKAEGQITNPVSTRLKSKPRATKSSTAIEIRCHDGPIVVAIGQSPEVQG